MVAIQQQVLRRWLGDPATYPIIGIIGVALCGGTFALYNNARGNPGVKFNKQERKSLFNFKEEEGASWRKHRFGLANLKANPINQSAQFDDLFKKSAERLMLCVLILGCR